MTVTVPFRFVDVFASEPLTGNPLSLVPDADSLAVGTMSAIAREFNQSETTFVLRPTHPDATWRLRSFAPAGIEVFGAGHNAMGAWLWLAHSGRLAEKGDSFLQQVGDDLLAVHVTRAVGQPITVSMDQSAPEFGAVAGDRAELATSLGLGEDDLVATDAAQVVSTGAEHLLVPARSREVVDRAQPDSPRLAAVLRSVGGEGCYLFSPDPVDAATGSVAYARFFNPTVGIAEDAATGTAAGPLVASGRIEEGVPAIVEQGYALGRPSKLSVTVAGRQVRLSGSGLIVGDGSRYI